MFQGNLTYLVYSFQLLVEQRASELQLQKTLFWNVFWISFQVVPAFIFSSFVLFHVFFEQPTFLLPCGFHSQQKKVTLKYRTSQRTHTQTEN